MTVLLQIALISNQHNFMKMNVNCKQLILVYAIWGLRLKYCLTCLWWKTIWASLASDGCCVNKIPELYNGQFLHKENTGFR